MKTYDSKTCLLFAYRLATITIMQQLLSCTYCHLQTWKKTPNHLHTFDSCYLLYVVPTNPLWLLPTTYINVTFPTNLKFHVYLLDIAF
jgi:hypothetical protein